MKLVNPPYVTTKCGKDDCPWAKEETEQKDKRRAIIWTEGHTFHTGHMVSIITKELYETEAFDSR